MIEREPEDTSTVLLDFKTLIERLEVVEQISVADFDALGSGRRA